MGLPALLLLFPIKSIVNEVFAYFFVMLSEAPLPHRISLKFALRCFTSFSMTALFVGSLNAREFC